MQSLNSEQGPRICSALKQTLRGSPWEEMKHQLKISASPGPVSIPAKGHPRTSFSSMNPRRTQSHLTVPPLQAKSSDREQDSVLPLSSRVLSCKAFPAKGTEQAKVVITWPQCCEWKKGFFQQVPQSLFYLSQQPFPQFSPPDQLALLGDPFSCIQVSSTFVQRGGVPAGISMTLWNMKLFPTRFNIGTVKYLKIKGFFFSPPPLGTLQSCSNSVSLHHWTLPFSLLPPYFSLFSLQLLHAALKIKIMPLSDSFAFTQHFP